MKVRLDDSPQLKLLAWSRRHAVEIEEREALAIYEANWRFVDEPALTESERALIHRLATTFGAGVLNV